jgi:hypothetical protein
MLKTRKYFAFSFVQLSGLSVLYNPSFMCILAFVPTKPCPETLNEIKEARVSHRLEGIR